MGKKDPDLLKPKLMKLAKSPYFYEKKVFIKHGALETIKEDSLEESLNEELYRELGNFGSIVDISRKQILEDYCCPEGKTPLVFNPKLESLPALPGRSSGFKETFQDSSKRRWDTFNAQLQEKDWSKHIETLTNYKK